MHPKFSKAGGDWFKIIIYLAPLAFFALFYIYPLLTIFHLSLAPARELTVAPFEQIFSKRYYLQILWFTTWQAVLSTLLTLLLALPSAYVFARYKFWGKTSLKTLSTLPFVLPTVVVANAFTALLGPKGLVNQILVTLFNFSAPPIQLNHTIWLILLAHVFYNYSIALRLISNFWQNLSPDLSQAAQMLGASPWRAFWHVTWPALKPAILAAGGLVFIFCFSSFGVILILGGPRFATLEVEIYRQTIGLANFPIAAALSIIQLVFMFGLMWVYTYLQRRMTRPLNLKSRQTIQKQPRTLGDWLWVGSTITLLLGLLGAPLLALVLRSFTGENGLTLTFYRQLFINQQNALFFIPPGQAIFNSTAIALVTMSLAVILGLITTLALNQNNRWSRGLDALAMLPLATSAVTLGFGFIVALDKPPLNLRSSLILVPIAHALVGMPFVIRSVLPALRSINPRLREAAALLGAAPQRVWREVDWPLIRRALLVGAVFAFTISMGEFGATLFIARPQTPTMPIAIYRFLSQPGAVNYGQALAMSSLLMAVCAIGFIFIERFKLGDEGEF